MLITLTHDADASRVKRALVSLGLDVSTFSGPPTQFVVRACSAAIDTSLVRAIEGVANVAENASPHPTLDKMVTTLSDGLRAPTLVAGPCSVESEVRIHRIAAEVARAGGTMLRGGAWKPRTSPHSFQGHGVEALKWMRAAADAHGLLVVTEALAPSQVEAVAELADVVQVGARSMQNFPLLHAIGRSGRPILLKRGLSATLSEWRLAAEHALVAGASQVIFCERGIRSFDGSTRNVLDLGAVAVLKSEFGLPVLVDPSHAAGRRDLLLALSKAAMTIADGLLIETHDDPGAALSDGPQALPLAELAPLWAEARSHHHEPTSSASMRRRS